MARTLKNDYKIQNVILESKSRTTAENAIFSREMLKTRGISKVLLVTHAWHMPRAKNIFVKAGFNVIAAPTMFMGTHGHSHYQYFPSMGAFATSYTALHELTGMLWYSIRY